MQIERTMLDLHGPGGEKPEGVTGRLLQPTMSSTWFYMRWGEQDIDGLSETGVSQLLTEVSADGFVAREVGLDSRGRVVHRAPSPADAYGLFDNASIAVESLRDDLSHDEFETYWRSGA